MSIFSPYHTHATSTCQGLDLWSSFSSGDTRLPEAAYLSIHPWPLLSASIFILNFFHGLAQVVEFYETLRAGGIYSDTDFEDR